MFCLNIASIPLNFPVKSYCIKILWRTANMRISTVNIIEKVKIIYRKRIYRIGWFHLRKGWFHLGIGWFHLRIGWFLPPLHIVLARQGIETTLSSKQQRRPLPSLLYKSFFFLNYPVVAKENWTDLWRVLGVGGAVLADAARAVRAHAEELQVRDQLETDLTPDNMEF